MAVESIISSLLGRREEEINITLRGASKEWGKKETTSLNYNKIDVCKGDKIMQGGFRSRDRHKEKNESKNNQSGRILTKQCERGDLEGPMDGDEEKM